jgi:hypothetical protein
MAIYPFFFDATYGQVVAISPSALGVGRVPGDRREVPHSESLQSLRAKRSISNIRKRPVCPHFPSKPALLRLTTHLAMRSVDIDRRPKR